MNMSEWNNQQVGTFMELVNGFAFKSADFVTSGIPIIKIKNVKPNKINLESLDYVSEEVALGKERVFIKPDDILITMSGNRIDGSRDTWVGKVSIFGLQGRYLLNQRVGALRRRANNIDNKYLAYCLSADSYQEHFINQANSSGGQANISPEIILSTEIPVPPIEEQRAIAEVLSSLDDKIDLLHRQNKTLESLAETLFRHWFLPVPACADRRDTQTGIDQANEDWEEKSLFDLIELVGGGTPKTEVADYWDGNIDWISGKDVTPNHKQFILNTEKKITELGMENSSAKYLPKFSTIITARGTVGNYCLLSKDMAFSQSNYGITPKVENCCFFTYLLIANAVDELKSAAYGSVFDTITTNTFKEHKVTVPSEAEIKNFEGTVSPYFEKMLANSTRITSLSNTRDALLPKLMNGEIVTKYDI